MTELKDLEPSNLWQHFEALTKIPRPSGHEERCADYLLKFAEKNGFRGRKDSAGNVIIEARATPGCADRPSVILQGHMDIVPVAAPGLDHDFLKDPVQTYVKDGFVYARGTTLGADDGIGIATALALMEDRDLKHGHLKGIFTVCEETDMHGAMGLDKKELEADYLINLDSEDNGILYVSCAGSADVNVEFTGEKVTPDDCRGLRLSLTGLSGGHSGVDIGLGRANALVLLATLLDEMTFKYDFFVSRLDGGQVRNAIPAQATAVIAVPVMQWPDFKQDLMAVFGQYREIYAQTDPDMNLEIEPVPAEKSFGIPDSIGLCELIRALPAGVQRMSDLDKEVVETSVNLGMARTEGEKVTLYMMPRSLKEAGLDDILGKIQAVAELLENVRFESAGRHPCWCSAADNDLERTMKER